MSNIRVLLVDDYPAFLEILATTLGKDARFEVVGRASSGVEALSAASRLRPDLVLMDVTMPFMDGIEATKRLRMAPDSPRVVLFAMETNSEREAAARQAGADGLLFKYEVEQQLLPLLTILFPLPTSVPTSMSNLALTDFVTGRLSDYEKLLRRVGVSEQTREERLRGARDFADLLFGNGLYIK